MAIILHKGQLGLRHLLPLSYWFERYARRRVTLFVFRLIALEVVSLLSTLVVLRPWTGAGLVALIGYFLAAWVGFTAFYELGYFMNDFWSEPREKRRAGSSESDCRIPGSRLLLGAVFTRLILVGAMLWLVFRLELPIVGLWYASLLVATGLVFALHNLLFFPARIGTFTVLYILKYMVCGLLVLHHGTPDQTLGFFLLVLPLALAYGFKYGLVRSSAGVAAMVEGISKSVLLNFLKRDEAIIPRFALLLLAAEAAFLAILGVPLDLTGFGLLAIILIALRYRRHLLRALKRGAGTVLAGD